MEDNKKFTGIRINATIHKLAKVAASIEDKSLQGYVEALIVSAVKKEYPDVYKKIMESE